MSDYSETFSKIDGNVIEAADFETEFQAIAAASATKFDKGSTLSPNFAGGAITTDIAVSPTGVAVQDFTGIPSWVKRITVLLDGISFVSGQVLGLQIGDSGGIETANYSYQYSFLQNATAVTVQSNTGTASMYRLSDGAGASDAFDGRVVLDNITGNVWIATWVIVNSGSARVATGGGVKTLSSSLTQVRLTNLLAANFDAGTVNIFYEG